MGTVEIRGTLFVLPIGARGCRFFRVHVGLVSFESVLASLAHLILRSLRVDGSRRRGRRVCAAVRVVKPWMIHRTLGSGRLMAACTRFAFTIASSEARVAVLRVGGLASAAGKRDSCTLSGFDGTKPFLGSLGGGLVARNIATLGLKSKPSPMV